MLRLFRDWLFGLVQFLLGLALSIKSLLGPAPGWAGFKRWLLQITVLGTLAGVGGLLFAVMGLAPIKASAGHWPITEWFLKFTMSRSVATQSLGIAVPALDDPGMVLKGATHFEIGCFPCHGNPSIRHPRVSAKMEPPPPYLPLVIHEWEPEQLFHIVKHGVKFTGMPAWPTQQRDDEVWAMVAFLQKFPELNEQEYQQMVRGENLTSQSRPPSATGGEEVPLAALSGRTSFARSISESCQRCHGVDGQGREAGVAPKLAGQKPAYLVASLVAYSQGDRHSGIMEPIAASLSSEEVHEVAQYYAGLDVPTKLPSTSTSELAIDRGTKIALEGLSTGRIPSCAQCHGPSVHPQNSAYPTLAGQYAEYLVLQLELFADERRGGSKFAPLMHPVVDRLTAEQMRDVALYYESQAAESAGQTR